MNVYKMCLVGDQPSGKTSLIHRIVNDQFTPEYQFTVGVDFRIKNIMMEGN